MALKDWSTTPADNDTAGSINFAEGQLPSTVNNSARQLMADVRAQVDDLEWRDWGHTPTRTAATTFTVPGDQTAVYKVGRRVRATDSSTLYGTITAVAYTTLTTVTVSLESGSLSASLTAVSVGHDPQSKSLPRAPTVSGFVSGQATYIDDDCGAAAAVFNTSAAIGFSWESIGPTGSGATNIWTALDAVPTTAKAVLIKILISISGSTAGQSYSTQIYARKTGSATNNIDRSHVARARTGVVGADGLYDATVTFAWVPIDSSRRFDAIISSFGTSITTTTDFYLCGWLDGL